MINPFAGAEYEYIPIRATDSSHARIAEPGRVRITNDPDMLAGKTLKYEVYVCTPDRKLKCRVRGITNFAISVKGFNDMSSIQFEVQKFITNHTEYEADENEAYDYLHAFCSLYVTNLGQQCYYLISQEPQIKAKGRREESKVFTAMSYESILQYENLVDFSVNQGTPESLEMFEENLDAFGIPVRNIQLYDENATKFSLLHLVLHDDYFGWQIGHVDDSLKGLQRSFEVSSQNVYSFLCNDISQAFQCIFTFDTLNKKINCYDVKTAGENTNIYLSLDHFLSEIDINPKTDDIYTVFRVQGGNDLGIERINFGSPKLINISYPLSMLDQELRDAYAEYLQLREQYRQQYTDDALEYANQLAIEQALIDRGPDSAVYNNWSSTVYYPTDELETYLANYKTTVNVLEQIYSDGQGGIDTDALDLSLDAATYYSYKEVCIPDIEAELKYRADGTKYEPVEYEIVWKLYGIEALETKLASYQSLIETLVEQGYNSERTTISEETWNEHHQEYLTYQQYVQEIEAQLAEMREALEACRERQQELLDEMQELAEKASINYYKDDLFTAEEIEIITSLYRESDYQNDNILITDIDDDISALAKAKDLYQDAVERMEVESVPQFTWTVNSENLFAMREFAPLKGSLAVGNFVNLYYGGEVYDPVTETFIDRQTLKFRVIEIDLDALNYNGNFNIVFTDMTQTRMYRNDFENLLNTMITSKTNSITNSARSSAAAVAGNVATSLLRPYMEAMEARIDNAVIQNANIINMDVINAQIENLTAQYFQANAASILDLYVDVIHSEDGSSWWNLKTGDMCLNGFLIDTEVEYAISASRDTAPTTGWSTAQPVVTALEPYVWMRTRMTLDGDPPTIMYSAPTCVTGYEGPAGDGPTSDVQVYVASVNWDAGTATLHAVLRINGTVVTTQDYPEMTYAWYEEGDETTVLGTSSSLIVNDLSKAYNCKITW